MLTEETASNRFATADVCDPPKKIDFAAWDARPLVRKMYVVESGDNKHSEKQQHTYINKEGYLERLMHAGRQVSAEMKTWRRKYLRLRDGYVYISEKSTDRIDHFRTYQAPMAGGRAYANEEALLMTVVEPDGKWSVFRCESDEAREQWLESFSTQVVEPPQIFEYIEPLATSRSSSDYSSKHVLVMDIGECSLRAGVLRNRPSLPDLFIPAHQSKYSLNDMRPVDVKYGIEAYGPVENELRVKINQPFKMSISGEKSVTDFDCLKGLFDLTLEELKLDPNSYTVCDILSDDFPFIFILFIF